MIPRSLVPASLFLALLLAACASPYDGVGREPPPIGAAMHAGRAAGR